MSTKFFLALCSIEMWCWATKTKADALLHGPIPSISGLDYVQCVYFLVIAKMMEPRSGLQQYLAGLQQNPFRLALAYFSMTTYIGTQGNPATTHFSPLPSPPPMIGWAFGNGSCPVMRVGEAAWVMTCESQSGALRIQTGWNNRIIVDVSVSRSS